MLNKSILVKELSKIMDSKDILFKGFPNGNRETADNWAAVIYKYAKTITPVTTTAKAAKAAMAEILSKMNTVTGKTIFIKSFSDFAIRLAIGTTGFYSGSAGCSY